MEITEKMIIEINNEIQHKFEAVYNKHLQTKTPMEFENYFYSVTEETWKDLRNLMEITNETVKAITKRRAVTKGRWLKNEFEGKNNTGYFQEVEMLSFMYDRLKDTDLDSFEAVWGTRSLEEAEVSLREKLESWETNSDVLICEFPYLNLKSRNQIQSAFSNDVRYLIVTKMKERYPKGKQGEVVSMPNSITNFPYDHTNRFKISPSSLEDSQYYKEVYFINDKTRFESRLNVEALQEGLMQENLKLLNAADQQILFYLMSLKHEALYHPVSMVVEIGDIVRNVYTADGNKNYLNVKESLIKMDHIEVRVIDETTLRSTKAEIFHKVTIEVDEVTNKEVARIIFSEDLIHEFVKNQTVSIYKEIIDRFTQNSTKVLIYPLQRQRIYLASVASKGQSLRFSTNISFFRGALVFGRSNRSKQIKVIEKALDEIVANKITLKHYERDGDKFDLEFYPITEEEKRDLLSNDAPERFLLSRNVDTI